MKHQALFFSKDKGNKKINKSAVCCNFARPKFERLTIVKVGSQMHDFCSDTRLPNRSTESQNELKPKNFYETLPHHNTKEI